MAMVEGKYKYCRLTYKFKDADISRQFQACMKTKEINGGALYGLLIYNLLSGPAFVYYNMFVNPQPLAGFYGIYGILFTLSVAVVHTLFFSIFAFETIGTRWVPTFSEPYRKLFYDVRSLLMMIYIVISPVACGLAMNVRSRHPCAPEQIGVMDVFYCSTSPKGMIPIDTFVIGQMLAVFQHFVFPIGDYHSYHCRYHSYHCHHHSYTPSCLYHSHTPSIYTTLSIYPIPSVCPLIYEFIRLYSILFYCLAWNASSYE